MDKNMLEKLKLNKQNVVKMMAECMANAQTPSENIALNHFYSDVNSSKKAPIIKFDYKKLGDYSHVINYMLGQLYAVHIRKEPFTINDGILDYNKKRWTDNDQAIYALYYMATLTLRLPYFVDGEKGSEAKNIVFFYDSGLIPTYSPDDPRFNLKDAEYALKELGVNLFD